MTLVGIGQALSPLLEGALEEISRPASALVPLTHKPSFYNLRHGPRVLTFGQHSPSPCHDRVLFKRRLRLPPSLPAQSPSAMVPLKNSPKFKNSRGPFHRATSHKSMFWPPAPDL